MVWRREVPLPLNTTSTTILLVLLSLSSFDETHGLTVHPITTDIRVHTGRRLHTSHLHSQTQESGEAPSVEKTLSSTPTPTTISWQTQTSKSCWRPTVSDVERISWGKPAKQKRTGSRGTPHRLNQDERAAFDQARRQGFLQVVGSGWRSQRRDAPLLNTYRSYCDAQQHVNLVLHKKVTASRSGGNDDDELVLDLSPLRLPETFYQVAQDCIAVFEGGEIDAGLLKTKLSSDNHDMEDEHTDDEARDNEVVADPLDLDAYMTRPIYQVAPYRIVWQLPRSEAKVLAKRLAHEFQTIDAKATSTKKSRKPLHVKYGKNRRHGGYGIG